MKSNFLYFYLAIAIVFLIGWVMNIYQIVQMWGGEITAKFIVKIVGIFVAPVGAVLGFIN